MIGSDPELHRLRNGCGGLCITDRYFDFCCCGLSPWTCLMQSAIRLLPWQLGVFHQEYKCAYWNSPMLNILITIFMFIFRLSTLHWFIFFLKVTSKKIFHDEELRWFFSLLLAQSVLLLVGFYFNGFETGFETSSQSNFSGDSCLTTNRILLQQIIPLGPIFLAFWLWCWWLFADALDQQLEG